MGVSDDGTDVEVAIAARAIRRIESGHVAHDVGAHHVHAAVALNRARVHGDALVAGTDFRRPACVEVMFPLGIQRAAITPAVADVPEDVRRHHHAARRQPPVVQTVAAMQGTKTQAVITGQLDVGIQGQGRGVAVGIHRHAGGAHQALFAGNPIVVGRIAALRRRTVEVTLVVAEIHVVLQVFAIGARLQATPGEFAGIVQVDALLVVA